MPELTLIFIAIVALILGLTGALTFTVSYFWNKGKALSNKK